NNKKIAERLMSKRIVISHTTMNKVFEQYGPESEGNSSPVKRLRNQSLPKVRTNSLIAKPRKICYELKGSKNPENLTKFCNVKKSQGVMFVAGISYRGPTATRFIPTAAKVTADFYIQNVMKLLARENFPRLYPGEEKKVILHQDSAPAHATNKTCQ
ncbi:uncharacterized protein LOC129596950, partial [Paramacrobiotus metropolitanus]|uniref:uncharacterized protein LOC129596950 n=1 Tax=Paramacrobiotus metropolitanus TaxID=2943436 RepID=UPI0024457B3F